MPSILMLLALLLLLLSACGLHDGRSNADVTPAAPGATITADHLYSLPTLPKNWIDDDALAPGRLAIREGCLYLTEAASPAGTLLGVQWPHGYSVRVRDGLVQVVDGGGDVVAQVGDDIALGGGGGSRLTDADRNSEHPCLQVPSVWFADSVTRLDPPLPPVPTRQPLPTRTFGGDHMDARLTGALVLNNGCLSLYTSVSDGNYTEGMQHSVIWPHGYRIKDRDGFYYLTNANAEVIAGTWEDVAITGGEVPVTDDLRQQHPCLQHPMLQSVWLASSVAAFAPDAESAEE